MRKHAAILLAVLMLAGCFASKGVRYSPQEIQGFPPEVQELIKNRAIALGMSQQATRYSWGAPVDVELKEKDGKVTEVWTYGPMRIEPSFIFVDGQITGIVFNTKKDAAKPKPEDAQPTPPATEKK